MSNKPTYVESKPLRDVVYPDDTEAFAKRLGELIRENAHCQGMTMNNLVDLTGLRLLTIERIYDGVYGPQGRYSSYPQYRRCYNVSVFNAVKITNALGIKLSALVEEVRKTVHCKAGYVDGNPVLYLSEKRRLAALEAQPELYGDANIFAGQLRRIITDEMDAQSITRAELAKITGISKPTIGGLLPQTHTTHAVGSLATYLAIAKALSLSISELFARADNA